MSNLSIYDLLEQKKARYRLCKDSLYLFGIYYFRHYFTHKSPEFHKERCKIVQTLGEYGKPRFLIDCEFRGSAKTSWAKIDFVRRICYKDRQYMIYGSKVKDIAQDALLDISLALQTNKLIIKDFGQLFYDTESKEKKSKKTGVGDFLTSNGVRVRAITTGQSPRGLIFNGVRPDYLVYDDFENNVTKKSPALTREVIDHFDELGPAIAPHGIILYLCNKISDTGSVAWLYDKYENNPEGVIFEKAVIEKGEITWTDKYVHTDKEAMEINATREKKKIIMSLESLKRTANKDGRKVYEQEWLNQPLVDGERFFDITIIDKAIDEAKLMKFEKDGNWKVWEEFDPLCRYKIAADVSEGYGLDSSVLEIINCDTGEQAAEFESNLITPGNLANEMIEASANYGDCTLTPERNSVGTAVISSLQEKGFGHLLTRQKVQGKKGGGKENRFGWNTNGTSKAKMMFDFQRDFNNGDIIIKSLPLLREMRGFANGDLKCTSFDEEVSNHFDRVMAFAIVNQTKTMGGTFALTRKKVNIGVQEAGNIAVPEFRKGKFKITLKH